MTWFGRPRDPQEQHGFDLIGAASSVAALALGWTQRFLEAQSGIDQTVISRIENGKQYGIRWSRFALLVDALGGFGAAGRPRALARSDPTSAGTATTHVVDLTGENDPGEDDGGLGRLGRRPSDAETPSRRRNMPSIGIKKVGVAWKARNQASSRGLTATRAGHGRDAARRAGRAARRRRTLPSRG